MPKSMPLYDIYLLKCRGNSIMKWRLFLTAYKVVFGADNIFELHYSKYMQNHTQLISS